LSVALQIYLKGLMMDEKEKPRIYTMLETSVNKMIEAADEQLEMAADLLDGHIADDPLDMKLVSYLCDAFSSNYHIRKILKLNLNEGAIEDEKTKEKIILLEEKDLLILENAILSVTFTKRELLKLNYSLTLH
jgi:hypothetical protein